MDNEIAETDGPEVIHVRPKGGPDSANDSPTSSAHGVPGGDLYANDKGTRHGVPELVGGSQMESSEQQQPVTLMQHWKHARTGWGAYIKTKDFWIVLLLGQVLSLCLTGQNTLSGLLAGAGVSIPALQVMPNYFLLATIYTIVTIIKYGPRGWLRVFWKSGWRYLILAFCDVQGNYFTVLAYRYTTILQAQLINIWAIVVVVIVSFTFLKVRYYWTQYLGILVALGGLGIMVASDHITGSNSVGGSSHVKGDLFALVGATFYGLSNVFEEFLVSKRPLYEVLGQLGTYALLIAGAQTAIFDRPQWASAIWTNDVAAYFTAFTLLLTLFYSLAPLLFRLSSAAFFNISLLTANFWGVCIGIRVFGYPIHWMYPVAFVVVLLGMLVYFGTESVMGEAKKPWLGEEQEGGVVGVGTARWRAERAGLRPRGSAGGNEGGTATV